MAGSSLGASIIYVRVDPTRGDPGLDIKLPRRVAARLRHQLARLASDLRSVRLVDLEDCSRVGREPQLWTREVPQSAQAKLEGIGLCGCQGLRQGLPGGVAGFKPPPPAQRRLHPATPAAGLL